MQIPVPAGIGTSVLFPMPRLPLAAPIPSKRHHPQRSVTRTNTPQIFYTTQKARRALPQRPRTRRAPHASVLFGWAASTQWERRQSLDWTGSSTTVMDLEPPSRSRSHAPAPGSSASSDDGRNWAPHWRAAHPRGRGRSLGGFARHPEAEVRPACVGLPDETGGGGGSGGSVSDDGIVLNPDDHNAPGSVMVGLRSAGVLGMIRGGLGQWCVRFILFQDGACSHSLVWWV